VKHFYVGNILYKYPQTRDDTKHQLARTTSEGEAEGIIKENYNNVWKPDKDEHEHFYGADDVSIKSTVGEKSSNQTSNSKERLDSRLPLAEKRDDLKILPIKRRLFNNPNQQSKGNNKHKNHVFFDIIPSENSPSRWAYYEEKPEEISKTATIMPSIESDPMASKELPRPMFPRIHAKVPQTRKP